MTYVLNKKTKLKKTKRQKKRKKRKEKAKGSCQKIIKKHHESGHSPTGNAHFSRLVNRYVTKQIFVAIFNVGKL